MRTYRQLQCLRRGDPADPVPWPLHPVRLPALGHVCHDQLGQLCHPPRKFLPAPFAQPHAGARTSAFFFLFLPLHDNFTVAGPLHTVPYEGDNSEMDNFLLIID